MSKRSISTTIDIRTGNGIARIAVAQSRDEILRLAQDCRGPDLVLTYTPIGLNRRDETVCVFNREANRVEYTGGQVYVGLGHPLGNEIGLQRGPVVGGGYSSWRFVEDEVPA